jgi:putative nucleotidyltransferase with HDIG domain
MVESISRNKDALISLLRVKEGDDYTFMHSLSVSTMLITFAKTVGIKGDLLNQYGMAGLMHDIGKMKIPLNILNKPGKLSDDEFALIQNHVVEGLEILNKDRSVSDIVLKVTAEHHERLDGSGYPNGLSGDQISLAGQMAAIVDVFDAMSSDRIFVSGIPPVVAINEIFKSRANHFKEDLVNKFINFIGIYPVGTLVKLESNRTAVVIESNHLRPIIRIVYENISRKKLMSRPIDLSQGTGLNDRIIGYEDPARIGLDMMQVMELAQLRY